MIVVSNTTPFSELAKVGRMNLLGDIFGKVIIPQEVYNEITIKALQGTGFAGAI